MSKSHSTVSAPASKPDATTTRTTVRIKPPKPYPDFPLYAHPTGYWAKKIRGRFYYFGPWADSDGALNKYLAQKDQLHAGRTLPSEIESLTIKGLVNKFLNEKRRLMESGELSPRMHSQYKGSCDLLIDHFGKRRLVNGLGPEDFGELRDKLAKKWGPVTLMNVIRRIRSVFRFG